MRSKELSGAGVRRRSTRRRHSGFAALAVLAVVSAGLVSASTAQATTAAPDRWQQPGGADSGNSMANLGNTSLTVGKLAVLRPSLVQPIYGSSGATAPLIIGSTAYIGLYGDNVNGNVDNGIRAISLATRRPTWTLYDARLGVGIGEQKFAFSGGTLFQAGDDSTRARVNAINPSTHTILWSVQAPPPPDPSIDATQLQSFAVGGGQVYLETAAWLEALDAATGHLLWKQPLAPGNGRDRLIADGSRLILNGGVRDGRTFRLLFTLTYGSVTMVTQGRIITADRDQVAAFPETGCGKPVCTPLWRAATGASDANVYPDPIVYASGGGNGTLLETVFDYSADATGKFFLRQLNAATGATIWTAPLARDNPPGTEPPIRLANSIILAAGNHLWALPVTCPANCTAMHAFAAFDQWVGFDFLAAAGNTVLENTSGLTTAYQ